MYNHTHNYGCHGDNMIVYSLCCAYLALKVEEYNLNVDQFVHVLMTELRAPAAEMILSYEVSPFCGWGLMGILDVAAHDDAKTTV